MGKKNEFDIAKELYTEYGDMLTETQLNIIASQKSVDKRLLNARYKLVVRLVEHHNMRISRKKKSEEAQSDESAS